MMTQTTGAYIPRAIANGIIALMLCGLLVTVCYFWVDKPVVYWVNVHHLKGSKLLTAFIRIPEVFTGLALFVFPLLALRFCYGKWKRFDQVLLAGLFSLSAAYLIRGPLKILFGRYWPATWIHNNPSLLHDNLYGFHWFRYGSAYAAFPSGHTAATVAVTTILWIAYPRWRWLAALLTVLIAVGLIGSNSHFVGDVVAGAFLGGLVAYYVAYFMGIKSNPSTNANPVLNRKHLHDLV